MADQVNIKKSYREDHWVVTAEIIQDPANVLPQAVFIYENKGTLELGLYQGVCSFEELQRLQVWSGQIIPVFGNRFVRHTIAESHLSQGGNPDRTVALIRAGQHSLKQELLVVSEDSYIYPV